MSGNAEAAPARHWQRHAPALLTFGGAALATAWVAWLADAPRLLGPFIASAGVLAAAPAAQRRTVVSSAGVAYGACAVLGAMAHLWLPAHVAVQGLVALVGFLLLRLMQRAHAPALAMLVVVFLNGASWRDLATVAGLTAALAAGAWLGGSLRKAD